MRTFSILLIFIVSLGYSQGTLPQDYFKSPIRIPHAVSGTFGELRSNHFHSGLDLKTQQKEGLPVYAPAAGTVSRIKVSHFGYGKALYITHPNGYTTVYAHLQKYAPKLEAFIKKKQYVKESYQIELFPKSGTFSFEQGELIGYSGNSGGSGGPHLHFEIRDRRSRPMNPLAFGIAVEDAKRPIIKSAWVYPLGASSHAEGGQSPVALTLTQQDDGNYIANPIHALGKIGLGVSTIDQQDLSTNKNGIYNIHTVVNGVKNFELEMKRFSFSETRYINRLIDYHHYKAHRSRITKLFVQPNNPLSIYKDVVDKGEVRIADSLSYTLSIHVKDFKQNTTTITIPVTGKQVEKITPLPNAITPHKVSPSENFSYHEGMFDIFIPKGSVYENAYLDIVPDGERIKVHRNRIPLHKNMNVVFDVSKYTAQDRKRMYIGRVLSKKSHSYQSTRKQGNKFSIKTRAFGTFALFSDLKKPSILPINVADNKWMSNETHLKVKINDAESGIRGYKATINGKFILMEYDYKTGMLVYDFKDGIGTTTAQRFKLTVTDKVWNTAVYEATFNRKL